jgi:hypothetical protein
MSRIFGVLLICALVFTPSSVYALAQGAPDLRPYPQKRVILPGAGDAWGVLEWHITGKKTSIVYIMTFDSTNTTCKIVGYKLSAQGVAGSPFTVLPSFTGYVYSAKTVWFDSAGGPAETPAGAAGLLFVSQLVDLTTYKTVISAVDVDADGKPIGSFRKIMEKTPPADERFAGASISASTGPESVSLILGFVNVRLAPNFAGVFSSKAYYLQTDLNGLQLGGMSEVPLPGAGNLNICTFGSPYWTGSGWMMPAYNTKMQVFTEPTYGYSGTRSVGNELYIYTFGGSAGAPAVNFKRRLLYKDNQKDETWSFRNATFLDLSENARPGAKKTKKTLTLFFGHKNTIPREQITLDRYTMDYYFVPIDLRGKRAGSSIKVDIPQWQHEMTYNPDMFIYAYTNAVSNLLPSSNGRFYLAQNRSTLMAEYVSAPAYYVYDCEYELSLYELDPGTGDVELIAQAAGDTPPSSYDAPILRWFNNKPAVLNGRYVTEPALQDQCYFTTISIR